MSNVLSDLIVDVQHLTIRELFQYTKLLMKKRSAEDFDGGPIEIAYTFKGDPSSSDKKLVRKLARFFFVIRDKKNQQICERWYNMVSKGKTPTKLVINLIFDPQEIGKNKRRYAYAREMFVTILMETLETIKEKNAKFKKT